MENPTLRKSFKKEAVNNLGEKHANASKENWSEKAELT
jgi:hypothetical protein